MNHVQSREDIDRLIKEFTDVIRFKMISNMYKAHWLDMYSHDYVVKRIQDELNELTVSIDEGDYKNALLECADIASQAMIGFDYIMNNQRNENEH